MNICVIPARGGSKGIKRKNLRFLSGKPLIQYSIENSLNSKYIDRVIVTTDDEAIKDFVSRFDVLIRERPKELAEDNVTLDPVIIDAINWYEDQYNELSDTVITIQPTSPLLTVKTLDDAIEYFVNKNFESLISVVDDTHLRWRIMNDSFVPEYHKRVNRQWLPKTLKETGTFVISKRNLLKGGKRIGGRVGIYEVPVYESIDIDSPFDWFLSSSLMRRIKINFVVTGNNVLGTGHVYRALTLADLWLGNDINFLLYKVSTEVESLIRNRGYKVQHIESLNEVLNFIEKYSIVINDVLDTPRDYVQNLKKRNIYVVNFEDLGDGSYEANLVFNALYERVDSPSNHKYGYKYECLNEMFFLEQPNDFNDDIKNIIITFGGSDPANLTMKTLKSIENIPLLDEINTKIVVGVAYKWYDELINYLSDSKWKNRSIQVMKNVTNMAKIMRKTDLAITSNGRTIYELISMGIPIISIAQNDRETMHLFARYSDSVKYLGIHCTVTEQDIRENVESLIFDKSKREKMYNSLPIEEIRKGSERVLRIIESEYWNWREENEGNIHWKEENNSK